MTVELKVSIKDSERSFTKEFLIYEPITLTVSDPIITECVNDAIEEFKGEPEDIKVKALMVLK